MIFQSNNTTPKKRTKNSGFYRFNFNGQERDDEVYGAGNSYTAEFWQYDPRLGRRWNVDPLAVLRPSWSPYNAFRNNPIIFVDPTGALDGWYEDESGEMVYDENINSKEDFDKSGIKGTWMGNRGIIMSNGMEVGEYTADGRMYRMDETLPEYTITEYKDPMDEYWENQYKYHSDEYELGKFSIWMNQHFGGADCNCYVSEKEKKRNIDVAWATVSVVGSVATLGTWGVWTNGARTVFVISLANNVDNMTSDGEGSTAVTNLLKKAGVDPGMVGNVKFAIDIVSLSLGTRNLIKDFASDPKSWSNEDAANLVNTIISEAGVIRTLDNQTGN